MGPTGQQRMTEHLVCRRPRPACWLVRHNRPGTHCWVGSGARIVIVTQGRPNSVARSIGASIRGRARIAIIAGVVVRGVYASGQRITTVVGARVAVITIGCALPHTDVVDARIGRCTRIAIITGTGLGYILATIRGVTAVFCASITIVAAAVDSNI